MATSFWQQSRQIIYLHFKSLQQPFDIRVAKYQLLLLNFATSLWYKRSHKIHCAFQTFILLNTGILLLPLLLSTDKSSLKIHRSLQYFQHLFNIRVDKSSDSPSYLCNIRIALWLPFSPSNLCKSLFNVSMCPKYPFLFSTFGFATFFLHQGSHKVHLSKSNLVNILLTSGWPQDPFILYYKSLQHPFDIRVPKILFSFKS